MLAHEYKPNRHYNPEREVLMSANSYVCSKCNGNMEQGFILDNTYGARVVSHWAAGAPQKSFWVGTKLPDVELIPIGAFRCSSCGYLESFARPEFAAQ